MKFTVLSEDRNCGNNCINEHGLSIYIELGDKKLLLDAGSTDAFLKNAETLNVNLNEINTIVLSHGHWDHGDGLKYIKANKTLILHPECYAKRYSLRRNMAYAGINESRDELSQKFNLIETKEPYQFFENVWYLGEINRKFKVPEKNLPTVLENKEIDYLYDDSGIAVKLEKGIIIFASCSHSGINNIIEQAKNVTNETRILAVIGGFHLKEVDEYTLELLQYFKDNNIKQAYMGHCTSDEVIEYFKENLNDVTEIKTLYAGAKFEIK